MRNINYTEKWKQLLTPEIVSLLTKIHEYKGEQDLFMQTQKDELEYLLESARVQSIDASNRIEGIYTTDERFKLIALNKTTPKTRNEYELAGYREALNVIQDGYEHVPMSPTTILMLHRDLHKFSGSVSGGKYKTTDNVILEEDSEGNQRIRFVPVESWATPDMINQLCIQFDEALNDEAAEPLLLIPMFVLDFLCIHPFKDGNGRMSRLLTLLLLYRAGYIVGKYISIEKLIEISKDTYYEALEASSIGWHEDKNDYAPFVRYTLGIIVSAYKDFSSRVWKLSTSVVSKPDRVRETIKETLGVITKAEIVKKCPDISLITIQRTLAELVANGEIKKIGGGRYTKYTWNWGGDNK